MSENSLKNALQNYEENVKRSIVESDISRIRLAHEVASRIMMLEERVKNLEAVIINNRINNDRDVQNHSGAGDNYNSCNFNS